MIRFALLLLIIPMVAWSEPVTIRSGEHETFSRLVLSIGDVTEWDIEQSGNTLVLQLEGGAEGFDTSEVFERIPRDRIAEISQIAPDSLRLTLACSCDYDAFLWRSGSMVFDIIDGGENDRTTPVVRPQQGPTLTAPILFNDDAPRTNTALVLPSPLVLERPDPFVASVSTTMPPPAENDLSATENALAEGIARAASQGFLNPSISQTGAQEGGMDEAPQEDAIAIVPADPPGLPNRPGVGVSTAMERDLASIGAVIEHSVDQHCLPADLFRVDEWGTGEGFHKQVAALAEELAGEFGEEPLEAQEALARLYVHFGFGAEARLVLSIDSASSRSRLVLSELAGIVDDYEGTYPLIAGQGDCRTSAALWAFLIDPTPQDEGARNHLMQQFFALPKPLRGQISPRLVRDFIEIGESDAAQRLLESTEFTDAGATHDVASARAFVAERTDDPVQAIEVLEREANDNARTTPESLIRLINLQLEQGIPPSEDDLLLVATLRSEYEGTPFEQQLSDVEAQGRISIGQFQPALDLVNGRDDEIAVSIVNDAFATMTQESSIGQFLEFAFGEPPNSLTPETQNEMAARLIELGFPERALTFLMGPAAREAASKRRYLRAEAAIATDDYGGVIEALLGIEDDRARALRARAYEGMGEYRAALAALGPEQPETSPTLQFRANAWERLVVEDDEVLSSFAQVVLNPVGENATETLADRRAILAQSQESRRAVESLLLRFDGTAPQE